MMGGLLVYSSGFQVSPCSVQISAMVRPILAYRSGFSKDRMVKLYPLWVRPMM